MPTWLLGWQGYLIGGALVAIVAGAGAGWVVHEIDGKAYAELELEQANKQTADVSASLNQLKGFISTMNAAAADYGKLRTDIFGKLDTINTDFRHAIASKPLPAGCAPDDGRVRALSAAIAAVNASTTGQQPSGAVSVHP